MYEFSRSGGNFTGKPDSHLIKIGAAAIALLFVLMCLVYVNTESSSADSGGGEIGDLTWSFDGDHTLTISGSGPMVMPDEGYPWGGYSENVTSVVIGSGVTSISYSAFQALNNINSVDFGDTVQTIEDYAFSTSDLSSLDIPDSVTSVGKHAFSGNPFSTLHVGKGLTTIGASAFQNEQLTTITVDPENTSFAVQGNVLYSYDMTKLFLYPGGSTAESFAFPDTVTELVNTFYNTKDALQSIILNANLETLCEDPFEIDNDVLISVDAGNTNFRVVDDSLVSFDGKELIKHFGNATSCTVPDGVETILDCAFYNFQGLEEVVLPSSVVTISHDAFYNCQTLETISGTGNVKTIGDWAFLNCVDLSSFTFGEDILYIGEGAFCNAHLSSIVIDGAENSVIGQGAFEDCKYVEVVTVTGGFDIGVYAFYNCGTSGEGIALNLGEGITSIGNNAFDGAKLASTSLTIPDTVTYVGDYAFSGTHLTSLTVGTGVTEFGYCPFYNCGFTTLNFNAIACEDLTYNSIPINYSEPISVTFGSSVQRIPACLLYSSSDVTTLTFVTIPNSVTAIGSRAFMHQAGITELTMSANIQSIGSEAFDYCSGLTKITLPASLTSLGQWAFAHCTSINSVTYNAADCASQPNVFDSSGVDEGIDVTFGDTVLSIPGNLFRYSKIGPTVTIPHGVTSIGEYAFQNCEKIVTVSIPDTVETLGYSPFGNCSALRTINYDAANVNSIYNYYEPFRNSGSADPGITLNIGAHVIGLAANIFSSTSNINVVNMGDNVEAIGSYAFNGTSITSIVIPSKVTQIGNGAFNSCLHLASIEYNAAECSDFNNSPFTCYGEAAECEVTIGNGVLKIPARLFVANTKITSVTMGTGVTYIGASAFQDCTGITTITIPSPVETIRDYAFQRCTGLTSVVYSAENCTSYGSSVFSGAGADSGFALTVSEGVTSIPNSAFSGLSNLKSVSLPSTLVTIGSSAFENAGITSVVIPDNVTTIGNYAFDGSTITSLTIGKKVESIGSYAFGSCSDLASITYNAIALEYISNPFNDGDGYAEFTLTIGSEVSSIPENLFYSLERLTGPLVISDSVLSIGSSAFYECEGLTSVVFGNGLQSIGSSAFVRCTGLASIAFGTGDLAIEARAFEGCSGVTSLTLPSNIASVGVFAFNDMSALTQINFNTNATFTGNNAVFNVVAPNCSVILGDGVTTLPYAMFMNCANLKTLVFNDDLETIEQYAFEGTGITTLTVPDSVRTIGFYAFNQCASITSITIPSTVVTIDPSAFNSFDFYDIHDTRISPLGAATLAGYSFEGSMAHMRMCDTGFSFVTNGGSAIPDLIGIEGRAVPLVPNPVRDHYTFHMWYSDEELQTPYTITVFPDSHITLYAMWIPETYTVTFDLNGGSPAVDPIEVTYPNTVAAPSGPFTKTGYTFADWLFEGYHYDYSSVVEKNITLTADWSQNNYNITLVGSPADNGSASVKFMSGINNYSFVGTNPGYDLLGFFTEQELGHGSKVIDDGYQLVSDVDEYTDAEGNWIKAENVTLYAQWSPKHYTYPLDENGGNAPGTATFTFGIADVTDFIPVTRTGYTCTGYYVGPMSGVCVLSAAGVLQPSTTYTDENGKWSFSGPQQTLYAKWEANTVAITLDGNGYGSEPGSATATYGSSAVTVTGDAARPGWVLTGYYSAADAGVLVLSTEGELSPSTLYTDAQGNWTGTSLTATLYAHWSPALYTITFTTTGEDTPGSATVRSGDTEFSNLVAPTSVGSKVAYYRTVGDDIQIADAAGNLLPNVDGFTNELREWIYTGDTALQLTENWLPKTYDIVLERNGGIEDGAATVNYANDRAFVNPHVSRIGYVLTGYFIGSTKVINPDGTLEANITDYTDENGNWSRDGGATFLAGWAPEVYTITLDTNTGDGDNVDVTVTFDTAVVEGYSAISKRGCTLTGYWTAESGGTKVLNDDGTLVLNVPPYTDASKWVKAEDMILYAQWAPNAYSVVLDGNGAGSVNGSAVAVFGAPLSSLSDAVREGYVLTGYFTAATDGTKVINDDGSLVADVDGYTAGTNWDLADDCRLYAQWTAGTFTVTYIVNGGDTLSPNTCQVTYGQPYELVTPTTSEPSKYFAGWKDAHGSIYSMTGTWSTADNVTLTAQWSDVVNYEISFTADVDCVGQPFSRYVAAGETIQLPECSFTKDGNTFDSWLLNSVPYQAGADYNVTADAVFVATWTLNQYYVKYMLDGAELTGNYAPAEHAYTSVVNLLAVYEKTGYSVTAWTTDDVELDGTNFVMPACDVVLEATSTAKTYQITIGRNGGDMDRTTTATYDSAALTAFTAISRTGYTLLGYYHGNDKVIDVNGALVANVAEYTNAGGKWIKAGNAELQAVWQANSQAIVLDKNDGDTPGTATVTFDSSEVTGFTAATRAGHTLNGFFTEVTGGTKVMNANGTLVQGVSGYTDAQGKWIDSTFGKLYAQWTVNSYAITLTDINTHEVIGHATVTYGATTADITGEPQKTGYAVDYYVNSDEVMIIDNDGALAFNKADYTDENGRWIREGEASLAVKWAVIPYQITLDKNGGDTGGSATARYAESNVYDLVHAARAHYNLLGYYTAASGGSMVIDANGAFVSNIDEYTGTEKRWIRTENTTLYAHWQLQSHQLTIHYVYADSSEARPDYVQMIEYGMPYSSSVPIITGYTPDVASVSGTMGDFDVVQTVTYTINQYTISFDSHGGTSVAPIVQDYNTAVSAPADPTKDGYDFKEWHLNSVKYEFTTMPAEDIELDAIWAVHQYTITYELYGGTNAPGNPASYTIETSTFQLADATRTGYDFGGWYLDSGFTEPITQVVYGSFGDKHLYAQWTAHVYSLTLTSTGATDGSASVTYLSDEIAYLVDAKVTGYNVVGYNTEDGVLVIDDERHLVASVEGYTDADGRWIRAQDTVLTPETEIQVHTLAINYQFSAGGTAAEHYVGQFEYGQAYDIASPAVTGYAPGNVKITGTMGEANVEETVLYTVNQYTITFSGNGGSPAGVVQELDYGATVVAPADPEREGFVFKGWEPAVPATMPAEDVTVNAIWSAKPSSPSAEVIEIADSQAEMVVIDLSVPEVADALNNGSKTEVDVKGDGWTMEIPKSVIAGATGNVSASAKALSDSDKDALPAETKKLIEGKTVFSLNLSDSNGAVSFSGSKIKVTLPYTLKEGENAGDVKVFYIDANNNAVGVATTYDSANDTVTFETDHFSTWFVDATPAPSGNGGDFPIWIVAVIIVIAVAGVGVFFFLQKKQHA